jgi:NAD+ synthase
MKVAIAQINTIVGNFKANVQKIIDYAKKAKEDSVDIVAFPELTVCGYSPQDLVLRKSFRDQCSIAIDEICQSLSTLDVGIIVGTIVEQNYKYYNVAHLIYRGSILHTHYKHELPNYDVFDEVRVFTSGESVSKYDFKGYKIGILICEDIWVETHYEKLISQGVEYLFVLNASPYEIKKNDDRISLLRSKAASYIIYTNTVGGQDSVVYDGGSIVIDKHANIIHQSIFFEEALDILDLSQKHNNIVVGQGDLWRDVYKAIVLSIRDYCKKNSFTDVILGYSSGIDSSLVAVLSIDALGKDHVHLVALPSQYTSDETYSDAEEFLKLNSLELLEIDIEDVVQLLMKKIVEPTSLVNENLQSRTRGIVLMALSNQHDRLLLSTGNKSELAVGYATLYGDMNGGFNPVKDLYKTDIYSIAKWRNNNYDRFFYGKCGVVIQDNIINKAPTAELKPEQKDSDTLPPYDILDSILEMYIERGKTKTEIINKGYDADIVDKVLKKIRMSEFKRYQSVPGPKIKKVSFGLGWRYPITNGFLE